MKHSGPQLFRVASRLSKQPTAPFPSNGKTFDTLFKQPEKSKKAWDGQDKDSYFRDRFAHVHAKQKEIKFREQAEARKRSPERYEAKQRANEALRPDKLFHNRHAQYLVRNPTIEFVFGSQPVLAALESRDKPVKLHTGHALKDLDASLLRKCEELKVQVKANVPNQHLNIMTNNAVHNKMVLEVHKRELPVVQTLELAEDALVVSDDIQLDLKGKQPLGLYIDEVTDSHNMGAILRSAYWLGCDFVAFSGRNCASISGQVVKASAGAAEFVQLVETPKPLKFFESLTSKGWEIVATVPPTARGASNLRKVAPEDLKLLRNKPCLLVVGSEGEGLRTSLLQRSTCVTSLKSAKSVKIDSLNVSVATALLLQHLA